MFSYRYDYLNSVNYKKIQKRLNMSKAQASTQNKHEPLEKEGFAKERQLYIREHRRMDRQTDRQTEEERKKERKKELE
jgi:hypothetical protein